MILGSSMLVSFCSVAAAAQQPQAAASAPSARTSKAAEPLLNADRALAAESRAIGFKAAYAKAMAPDARKLDGGQQPTIGRDSILALMARYPAGLSIDWTPEEAVVAESGELGFTGSARQSVKVRILRGFLKSNKFGLCGSQALRFQQQIVQIPVTTSSSKQGFDVAIHCFDHAHRDLCLAIIQNSL